MSAVKRVEISASFKNESVVKTILLITEKFHEKRLKTFDQANVVWAWVYVLKRKSNSTDNKTYFMSEKQFYMLPP